MKIVILIQLLLAHILTDFVIQSDHWVKKKKEKGLKSGHFWIHILLSGLLTYLIIMQWSNWLAPFIILVTHGIIDYWKIRKEQNKHKGIIYFFIDQSLHIFVIILVWLFLTSSFDQVFGVIAGFLMNPDSLAILTAFVIVIWPAGTVIEKITESLRKEIESEDSLPNAGMYIGISERILVLIFILIGQYVAIGFLIAGKSILRVARDTDQDARKKTEYVLIGTLISFAVAIVIGLLTTYIMDL
jgi:hypothetical protein